MSPTLEKPDVTLLEKHLGDFSSMADIYFNDITTAYDDLLRREGQGSDQLLNEEANALSHIATSFLSNSPEIVFENVIKAKNHLQRLALDVHKTLWAETLKKVDKQIDRLCELDGIIPNFTYAQRYSEFLNKSRQARQNEILNVGVSVEEAILKYRDAIDLGIELYDDLHKALNSAITISWIRSFMKDTLVHIPAHIIFTVIYVALGISIFVVTK